MDYKSIVLFYLIMLLSCGMAQASGTLVTPTTGGEGGLDTTSDQTITGDWTFDTPVTFGDGFTFDDPYDSAIMFSVPSSNMLPPVSKGGGLLMTRGALYSRALVGGVMKYYTGAGAAQDDTKQEYFFCDDTAGAYSMPTTTPSATPHADVNTTAYVNGWVASTSPTGAAGVTFALDGTDTCTSFRPTSLASYASNVNQTYCAPINYPTANHGVFVDGKSARNFWRVRFPLTGSNASAATGIAKNPHSMVGVQTGYDGSILQGIYVGVSYGGTGGAASNAKVWVRQDGPTFTGRLDTAIPIASATEYTDIEIKMDGTTGFDVYINGVFVCDETTSTSGVGEGVLTITSLADWDGVSGWSSTGLLFIVKVSGTEISFGDVAGIGYDLFQVGRAIKITSAGGDVEGTVASVEWMSGITQTYVTIAGATVPDAPTAIQLVTENYQRVGPAIGIRTNTSGNTQAQYMDIDHIIYQQAP